MVDIRMTSVVTGQFPPVNRTTGNSLRILVSAALKRKTFRAPKTHLTVHSQTKTEVVVVVT